MLSASRAITEAQKKKWKEEEEQIKKQQKEKEKEIEAVYEEEIKQLKTAYEEEVAKEEKALNKNEKKIMEMKFEKQKLDHQHKDEITAIHLKEKQQRKEKQKQDKKTRKETRKEPLIFPPHPEVVRRGG